MALIKVNERDSSWYYRQRVSGQLAVLVPGVATFGPENEPVYLTSDNFTQVLGTSSVDSRDTSYSQAASFIAAGADVLFWRIPLKGSSAAYHRIKSTAATSSGDAVLSYVEVRAKYTGSFGNNLKYKCYQAGTSRKVLNYRFLIYSGLNVVETLIVNFEDLDSEYYYETVNQSSRYVEFEVHSELKVKTTFSGKFEQGTKDFVTSSGASKDLVLPSTPSQIVDVKLSVSEDFTYQWDGKKTVNVSLTKESGATLTQSAEVTVTYLSGLSLTDIYSTIETSEAIPLAGGSDGTYSKQDVTDALLRDSKCHEVVQALIDPLQYSFNLIVDGGYNEYKRYLFDTTIEGKDIQLVDQTKKIDISLNCNIDTRDGVVNTVTLTDSSGKVLEGAPKLVNLKDEDNTEEANAIEITSESCPKVFEIISNLDNPGYVNVSFEGVKVSEFAEISRIDDLYIYIAEKRGLAIYLVDGSRDWSPEQFYNYTGLPNFDSTLKGPFKSTSGFNTSYAAAYGPWTSAQLASTGITRSLPGSYALITAWSQSISSGVPMYYAPAGVKRTHLSLVNSTVYPVDSAINELWQNQDVTVTDGHKINPIMNLRQYGYVIYGNSTLLKNRADGATSMLQSMSTRILANLIKQRAFDISLSLQFDQIDSDLFSQFRTLLTTYMDTLKYRGALYDYLIIADYASMTLDDLNSRTVPVTIKISPNPAAENFVINLEISQAGVSFADTEEQTSSAEG